MPKKKPRLQLRDFQKEDVAFMKANNYRVLVANGQGTGKTIECLAAISIDRKMLCPALIVCPSSVVINWYKEARKWCPWARVHPILDRATPLPRKRHHIYVISWNLMAERAAELVSIQHRLLIADEAQYAKNDEAIRSQTLAELAKLSPHLLLLSGTPLINSRSELINLYKLFGSEEKPAMIRRLLGDVAPDVPEKVRMTLPVYLRPRHAREYRKAFEEFDEWLKEELAKRMSDGEAEEAAQRALAAEALIKIGYLRRLVGVAKTYACVDWISRAVRVGEPVVIFCEHGDVINRIQKMLKRQGISYVTVRGSTPKNKRQHYVEQFQAGSVPVFIGTKAAHTGITLTRARHLCFAERFWTSADEEQAEDRIRRISQKYPTKIWFLHAVGTVDDRIAEIIERKRRIIDNAIGSEEISNTEERTVLELVSRWSEEVNAPTHKGDPMLGLVSSLPPLPKPKEVQAIIFIGTRWNAPSVRAWCKMNKYIDVQVRKKNGKKIEATLRSPSLFRQGSLKTVKVSKSIYILTGHRLKRPSAKQYKRQKRMREKKVGQRYLKRRRKAKRKR